MQFTRHFKQSEFACKHCGESKPNLALAIILEDVREAFSAPVTINSSYRCEEHNKAVGGATSSQHLLGTAADIVVQGVSPEEVYSYLSIRPYADNIGLGKYNTFTHIDVRGHRARWDNTYVG